MAANRKVNLDEAKKKADAAGREQVNDIMNLISDLGTSNESESEHVVSASVTSRNSVVSAPIDTDDDFVKETPVMRRSTFNRKTGADLPVENTTKRTSAKTASTTSKANKPGYISLVIPNSLKTKWKVYSSEHGMSLTDCMKLAMKLLEDMEQKEAISVEDGFITYLN